MKRFLKEWAGEIVFGFLLTCVFLIMFIQLHHTEREQAVLIKQTVEVTNELELLERQNTHYSLIKDCKDE